MPFVGSLNRVVIIGNIANDPMLNYTQQTNTPVCRFTVATNRKFKTQAGELREEAAFHRITVWGPRAENLSKILSKGTKVYVEGRIVYVSKENGEHPCKEAYIRASDIIILSRKRTNGDNVQSSSASSSTSASEQSGSDDILDLDAIAQDLTDKAEAEQGKSSEAPAKEQDQVEKSENGAEDSDLPF